MFSNFRQTSKTLRRQFGQKKTQEASRFGSYFCWRQWPQHGKIPWDLCIPSNRWCAQFLEGTWINRILVFPQQCNTWQIGNFSHFFVLWLDSAGDPSLDSAMAKMLGSFFFFQIPKMLGLFSMVMDPIKSNPYKNPTQQKQQKQIPSRLVAWLTLYFLRGVTLKGGWFLISHPKTSWWLNQPLWKICSSKWESSPNRGWK